MHLTGALSIFTYVATLFLLWTMLPFTCLLLTLRFTGVLIDAKVRALLCFATPVFAVSKRVLPQLSPFLVMGLCAESASGQSLMPPAGSPERILGDKIFAFLFSGYAILITPSFLGVPINRVLVTVPRDLRARFRISLMLGGAGISFIAAGFPGRYCWAIVTVSYLFSFCFSFNLFSVLANQNKMRAPLVDEVKGGIGVTWLFLHTSDVHSTVSTTKRPKRLRNGSDCLSLLASDMTQRAALGQRLPALLIDTGDLVDRGLPDEWQTPVKALLQIKKVGIRVLLTPGNHDLVPAYDYWDTLFAFWAAPGKRFLFPENDGERLLKYLTVASTLEPDLLTSDGRLLKDLLRFEEKRQTQLIRAWDSARESVPSIARKETHSAIGAAFRRPLAKASVAIQFSKTAHQIFPEWDEYEWLRLFMESRPQATSWSIPYKLWAKRWFSIFPLRLSLRHEGVEILILNSVEKEARLAGSARGFCGHEQYAKLRQSLLVSSARTILVLQHHAPFRFPSEKNESTLQRWAMLAHNPEESIQLARLLVEASSQTKQIILLSGHIHMRSRCGVLRDLDAKERSHEDPPRSNVLVFESGALGEPITDHLLSGWLTQAGSFQPQLMPRPA